MGVVKNFEDLTIWKESMQMVIQIYNAFKDCKDFAFKDQIQRAAVSIPSNIAEGFERKSNKEFIQFLFIAKGSCGELRTQLYIAAKLKYVGKTESATLIENAKTLSAQIAKLISYRNNYKSK